jgi:co-chaperonin GroES (HSP10)
MLVHRGSLFAHIFISRLQKTASGLFLPTSATNTPLPEATVVAVGPGATDKDGKLVSMSVQAGDRVLLPGWGGNAIKVGEEVRSAGASDWMTDADRSFCRSTTSSVTRRSLPRSRSRCEG